MSETRWLSQDEQVAWRSWLTAQTLLAERLEHDMKAQHGITMVDYEILVRLSESTGRRLRMSELASRTLASKSRLSHQITRMEVAGLVTREECTEDRRGAYAVMTARGWETLVTAAPDHVASVRGALLEALPGGDFLTLGALSARVVDHLNSATDGAGSPQVPPRFTETLSPTGA